MKTRLSILVLACVLIVSAPLIAYTINLDAKSGVKLSPKEQEIISSADPSVRTEEEMKALEKEKQRALEAPRENIIYLNGKPKEEWPK